MYSEISFDCPTPVMDESGRLIDCGSGADTPETVEQIRKHNARYSALCKES